MDSRLKIIFGLLLLMIMQGCSESEEDITFNKVLFNSNWEFIISEDSSSAFSNESKWQQISLPHTPVIEPILVNNQWQGTCWYRKSFTVSDEPKNKKLFLKFEGAMNGAEIWVNGIKKIHHKGGYLPFTIDISNEAVTGGSMEVIVKLDNRDNPITGPKPLNILDFNTYGGLYRDVWMITKNPIHITDPLLEEIPSGGGIFIRQLSADSSLAELELKMHIRNSGNEDARIRITNELWLDEQMILDTEIRPVLFFGGMDQTLVQRIKVDSPGLWSPQSPVLHKLITRLFIDEQVVDQETTMLGIKWIEFIDNQLFLNGKKHFLRGVNRHQEYPYIGYALSNEAQYRDAVKIKEAGFDYVRLSHYPHSPAFMKACDEIGLLVIDAILGWQYYADDRAFQHHVYQTAKDLIRRDRNHACVLAWEVSLNESWMPEFFIDSLTRIAHREYPGDQCFTAGWQSYGYDIYLQARQHRLNHYTEPEKPYVVSEYGDWEYYAQNAGLNQDSWKDLQEDERTSRQLISSGEKRLLQQSTNIQEAHNDNFNTPAFGDGYWVMYDYNRGYADDIEASGIMSINRLPKFSYHFFRSQRDASETSELYSSGPMVYIASYWKESSSTDIRVFSNCDEVELYLNDSLIARQTPDQDKMSGNLAHPPFTFSLNKYSPGTLKAIGFIDNIEASTTECTTPGKAVGLKLWWDESGKPAKAGVNDIIFVYAALVDIKGNTIPDNGTPIEFIVEGDAHLISPPIIKTEAGISSALIRIGDHPGPIQVQATSKQFPTGKITITSY